MKLLWKFSSGVDDGGQGHKEIVLIYLILYRSNIKL